MSRPPFSHLPTSVTQVGPDDQPSAHSEKQPLEDSKSGHTSPTARPVGGEGDHQVGHPPGTRPHGNDILAFIGIFIMLIWPWVFFGVVWAKKGIRVNNHVADVITRNPQTTTYFITLICSIITMISGALFSRSIIRFAQELVTHRKPSEPFTLTVLFAFKSQSWPWEKNLEGHKHLLDKKRWWPAVLLIICVLAFPQLVSSITSLLTPAPFNRNVTLTGTELDFSSTAADCQAFLAEYPINNNCGWQFYQGLPYTNCLGENQMVDVLEAGRGNIIELLSDNNQSLTFSQLGGGDGLHFLGPIRGVLPIGPNGVPQFDTLERFPLTTAEREAGVIPYNYTLNYQGLTSNVSCSFAPTYPFHFESLDPTYNKVLAYNATCATLGQIEVLTNVSVIPTANSNNLLVYWACQSVSNGAPAPSYTIYLAGINYYASEVGNITCTVNPIQSGVFPVTYHSTANIFTTTTKPTTTSPIAFSNLVYYALLGLGDVISEAQNSQANLVAESVFTFGTKAYGLLPQQHPLYLQLFERMIQGIIEYEATYTRLIFSTVPDRPASCNRTINGTVNYKVLGWFVTAANIGFLVPSTIINGAAFIALLLAVLVAKDGGWTHHPHDPRPVTHVERADQQEEVPDEWRHKISFHPMSYWKDILKGTVEDKVTAFAENARDKALNDLTG